VQVFHDNALFHRRPSKENGAVASVLIVDDDPSVLAMVKRTLERAGHDVAVAADGRAGIAALDAGNTDLLIVDIFMPTMDGLELLRDVRRHRPGLPVVVTSGVLISTQAECAPDFLAMAVKLGAVRGIRKPFAPDLLIRVVDECLNGQVIPRQRRRA
jgi:CheY-like chemotaxis protein